jgi:small conductance mechanosensitive channel
MDLQQQLIEFRNWALHFEGATQKWMWSVLALAGGWLLGLIAARSLRFAARKLSGLAKRRHGDTEPKSADHVMIDVFGALVRALFFLVALALVANLLFGYSLEEARALAISALKGLGILVGVWFLGSWLGSRVRKFGEKVGRRTSANEQTLFHFLAALVRFGAFAIGLIAALQQFGFPIASLVAVIGAAGLAIALALQDTLKAVAAGVIIAVFRPYRIGDAVRIAGQDGVVADITPFTTVLSTIDNREITVTNDKAWGDVIVNSSTRSLRRLDLAISISYEDDIDRAINVIRGVLEADSRVRDEPPIWVKVQDLSFNSVDLRVRAWCSNSDWVDLRGDMLMQIKQVFDREGITIPHPILAQSVARRDQASVQTSGGGSGGAR